MRPTEEHAVRRQIARRAGFYRHATVFVGVNTILLVGALVHAEGAFRMQPILGWGLGLALHGLAVFAPGHWFGAAWQAKVRERLARERHRGGR